MGEVYNGMDRGVASVVLSALRSVLNLESPSQGMSAVVVIARSIPAI